VAETAVIYNTSYHTTIKMTPWEAENGISHQCDANFVSTNPYMLHERTNKETNIIPRDKLNQTIKENLEKYASRSIILHKKNKKVHEYNIGDLVSNFAGSLRSVVSFWGDLVELGVLFLLNK